MSVKIKTLHYLFICQNLLFFCSWQSAKVCGYKSAFALKFPTSTQNKEYRKVRKCLLYQGKTGLGTLLDFNPLYLTIYLSFETERSREFGELSNENILPKVTTIESLSTSTSNIPADFLLKIGINFVPRYIYRLAKANLDSHCIMRV